MNFQVTGAGELIWQTGLFTRSKTTKFTLSNAEHTTGSKDRDKMLFFKLLLLITAISFISYFMTTTVVDIALMGRLNFCFSAKVKAKEFLITKANRIDFQDGFKCSGFSSAFVMRHWNISADGNSAYEKMPNKMRVGYVYPKGIFNFLSSNGFKVKYCRGNLNSLKNAVPTGNPVIAMIKIRPDKNWLHYVPVVGYDGQNIFVAESLAELSNCNEPHYNRRIPAKEFKKLWNTAMPKMPLYANTFFTVER